MKPSFCAAVLVTSLTLPGVAFSQVTKDAPQTLTAVCKGPTGHTLVMGNKRAMEPDGFSDGMFTYSWRVGSSTATIISQSGSAAGGTPSTESATAVASSGFVTFFVMYDRAVWMHSLFLDSKTVLMSRHVNSMAARAPLGGIYTASCSVSVQ